MSKNKREPSEWSIYGIITLIFAAIGLLIAALSVPQINEMVFGKPEPSPTPVLTITPEPMIVTTSPEPPTEAAGLQSAEDYFESGLNHYSAGNYDEAIADLTHAIELDSDNARAWNSRGDASRQLEQYEQAVADYSRAIELDETYLNAFYNRGVAYYQLGNYEQAIADCLRTIELDENFVNGYYNCGLAYHFFGDYEQAITYYTHASEMDENAPDIYWGRGTSYYRSGIEFYELAIADYKRYAEITGHLEPFMEEAMTEMQAALDED